MTAKTKRMIYVVITGLVLGYMFLVGFVYIRQGSMLYYPSREIEATPKILD